MPSVIPQPTDVMDATLTGTALLLALLIDWRLGEPPARWHPVVWIGRYLGWAGRRVAPALATPGADYKSFGLGALVWSAGAATVCAAAWFFQKSILQLPEALGAWPGGLLAALLLSVLLKPLLACSMLLREVQAVEDALSESLAAGRQRLAWLVSRDVTILSESEVRESAIESLAENLNDSVVAPIFWFVLLGLPGAALYRFANTADAMWGYRGVRDGRVWEWAGKWAAWADDVLSWVPARLTAVLLMGAGRVQGAGTGQDCRGLAGWRALPAQARLTPSPNSGWPMAAMALVLGVRLGKPGAYTLCAANRAPQAADAQRALSLAKKTVFWLALSTLLAIQLIAIERVCCG